MGININQYSQMFGRPLTAEEIQAFQVHSMALSQLINNAVFENEFDSQKFIIDETIVASETKNRFPNLYKKNNKLNETALNSFLSQQNLKIDDLVKIIDYEARERIFEKLFFAVDYPNKIETLLNKYNNHIRNTNLINFNINDFQLTNINDLNISINNNQIINFFNQNINSYINPEKRNISYIVIDKEDYSNQFIPSNSQIENYYNKNFKLYLDSEKRDFIQFNFKNLDDASKFKKNINSLNEEEIIKFAKENNLFFNEFSKVSYDEVLEDLSNVIFDLEKNQISQIVETPLAKHIVIVNNIYPEVQKTLDQSKQQILETLLEAELDNYYLDLKNKINQQILDGLSLNEIAGDNLIDIKFIKNAERNEINGLKFYTADVGKFLYEHPEYKNKIRTIILDPSRAGIAPKTLLKIIAINAERIVYVSCNPATQARDTVEMMNHGYEIKKISLVDQFPHTSHIETVVLFEKI